MCLTGCNSPQPPTPASGSVAGVEQSCPSTLPATCPDAPAEITLPKAVNDAMKKGFTDSFPGGKSQEQGGTLVQDAKGEVRVVNVGSGTSGTFQPDRTTKPGEKIIGTFHTHPYDASEGGHKGVSFSGADINYAVHHQEPIYVDAGDKQFMIMPSKASPAAGAVDYNAEWNQEFQKELAAGKSMQEASSTATNTIAKKHGMAYYEGKDGKLKRISC